MNLKSKEDPFQRLGVRGRVQFTDKISVVGASTADNALSGDVTSDRYICQTRDLI